MRQDLRNQVKEIQKRHKQQSKRRGIRSALSIVVVFSVLFSLLLPAFTLEKTAYCGMIEHTHTDACYQYVLDCPVTGEAGTVISSEEFNKLPGAGSYDGEVWEVIATDGDFHENLRVIEEETSEESYEDEVNFSEDETVSDGEDLVVSPAENATPSDYVSDHEVVISEGAGPVIASTDVVTESFSEDAGSDEENVPEDANAPVSEEDVSTHVHTAECYRKVLICGLQEHTHDLSCFVDRNSDTEDPEDIEALFPTFEDEKAKDSYEYAAKLAEFQKGYRESVKNYMVLIDE